MKSPSGRQIFAQATKLYNAARRPQACGPGFSLLKQAADLGLADAHELLGWVYLLGLGTPPNRRLSFKHYRIAADPRRPDAEYHVGISYDKGIGVRKDRSAAIRWMRKAARHGSTCALHWLGWHYLSGRNPRYRKKGFEYLLKAANREEIQSQHGVGICYERGAGVPTDAKEACKWYLRAAKRGYPYAADALARCYETGFGVRIDKRKSAFWRKRAQHQWARARAGWSPWAMA